MTWILIHENSMGMQSIYYAVSDDIVKQAAHKVSQIKTDIVVQNRASQQYHDILMELGAFLPRPIRDAL